jgi:hypothetical protein
VYDTYCGRGNPDKINTETTGDVVVKKKIVSRVVGNTFVLIFVCSFNP